MHNGQIAVELITGLKPKLISTANFWGKKKQKVEAQYTVVSHYACVAR